MHERRAKYEEQSGLVDQLIVEGTARTRKEVQDTVFATRKAMGLTGAFNQLRRKAERTGRLGNA
jgi:tryptophanyl-tRNA synthetase